MVTAAEIDIEKKAASVPPGTFRHTVLVAAKRFKSTWAELGKLLVQVRDENLWEPWGYDSFEAYCLKELHIKKQTALKLTRSFSFLAKHEAPEEVSQPDFPQRRPPSRSSRSWRTRRSVASSRRRSIVHCVTVSGTRRSRPTS